MSIEQMQKLKTLLESFDESSNVKSDTPRCDAAKVSTEHGFMVPLEVAQEIKKELIEAESEINSLYYANSFD